jgi:large subunit ribosomal protein L30e
MKEKKTKTPAKKTISKQKTKKTTEKATIEKEIRRAVDTGKTHMGHKQAEKKLIHEKPELIIMPKNTQPEKKEKITYNTKLTKTPLLEYDGTGIELGAICGKPYTCSALTIMNKGKSKILEITKEKMKQK